MKRIIGNVIIGFIIILCIVGIATVVLDAIANGRERTAIEARLDSLSALAARVDTVYHLDTVVLWRNVRSLDTLTETVEVWKHDTVRVVEYVERATATLNSCLEAVLTCEARDSLQSAHIATLEQQWNERPRPPKPRHPVMVWGERGLFFVLGWLSGR